MAASYRSPKTRVARSPIHGRGLFAVRRIRRGEIVAIKGGHVLDRWTLERTRVRTAVSYIQIEDGFYIGARVRGEVARNKLFLNHSCAPNVGIRGQVTFVALRDVRPGEELTYDWAMEENAPAVTMCRCGVPGCRRRLTGQDWRQPALQRRYRGFFSAYLAAKIAESRRPGAGRMARRIPRARPYHGAAAGPNGHAPGVARAPGGRRSAPEPRGRRRAVGRAIPRGRK